MCRQSHADFDTAAFDSFVAALVMDTSLSTKPPSNIGPSLAFGGCAFARYQSIGFHEVY